MSVSPSQTEPRGVPAPAAFRQLTDADIRDALLRGWEDMRACRTDVLVMVVLYPLAALFVAGVIVDQGMLPFVFPVCAGFALIGPLATLWFAALSRAREETGTASAEAAASVFDGPRRVTIQRLSLIVIALFLLWLAAAGLIYALTLGASGAEADAGFFVRVFTTGAGWAMIVLGCLVGGMFALIGLAIALVSFPLALDRTVSTGEAIGISIRAVSHNPGFALLWGGIIVLGLIAGAVPGLLGLALALPVLGHANWHLYRKMIAR